MVTTEVRLDDGVELEKKFKARRVSRAADRSIYQRVRVIRVRNKHDATYRMFKV